MHGVMPPEGGGPAGGEAPPRPPEAGKATDCGGRAPQRRPRLCPRRAPSVPPRLAFCRPSRVSLDDPQRVRRQVLRQLIPSEPARLAHLAPMNFHSGARSRPAEAVDVVAHVLVGGRELPELNVPREADADLLLGLAPGRRLRLFAPLDGAAGEVPAPFTAGVPVEEDFAPALDDAAPPAPAGGEGDPEEAQERVGEPVGEGRWHEGG